MIVGSPPSEASGPLRLKLDASVMLDAPSELHGLHVGMSSSSPDSGGLGRSGGSPSADVSFSCFSLLFFGCGKGKLLGNSPFQLSKTLVVLLWVADLSKVSSSSSSSESSVSLTMLVSYTRAISEKSSAISVQYTLYLL